MHHPPHCAILSPWKLGILFAQVVTYISSGSDPGLGIATTYKIPNEGTTAWLRKFGIGVLRGKIYVFAASYCCCYMLFLALRGLRNKTQKFTSDEFLRDCTQGKSESFYTALLQPVRLQGSKATERRTQYNAQSFQSSLIFTFLNIESECRRNSFMLGCCSRGLGARPVVSPSKAFATLDCKRTPGLETWALESLEKKILQQ